MSSGNISSLSYSTGLSASMTREGGLLVLTMILLYIGMADGLRLILLYLAIAVLIMRLCLRLNLLLNPSLIRFSSISDERVDPLLLADVSVAVIALFMIDSSPKPLLCLLSFSDLFKSVHVTSLLVEPDRLFKNLQVSVFYMFASNSLSLVGLYKADEVYAFLLPLFSYGELLTFCVSQSFMACTI